ncbi:MAG: hypothetical protein P4L72_02640 [Parvibaculum sp.]|uniref:hypothetical protein n=1 Tax=Parvibaculum sp. TaxID=2024848 RepID=UPI002842286C|nr:hypothetical protein [Parvibaculum sp.]MDR3498107.1 hypothetical protein [Parvibaculum sp.]
MTANTNRFTPDMDARWESLHRLYDLFIETLTAEAKAPEPKASMLNVIREFLKDNARFLADHMPATTPGQLQSVKAQTKKEHDGWGIIGGNATLPDFKV